MFVNMPYRIHKCTNTLYDYAIINYYFSLMYELKKIGKIFTSKFVGTGPSSYKKIIYRAAVSQRLRNTVLAYQRCTLPPTDSKPLCAFRPVTKNILNETKMLLTLCGARFYNRNKTSDRAARVTLLL